jgi:hypothetical protein
MWVCHLSERIHSIDAKTKSNIPWIIREVLLMTKVKMSDHTIPLSLDMPKQELNIPRIGEHMLQAINDR